MLVRVFPLETLVGYPVIGHGYHVVTAVDYIVQVGDFGHTIAVGALNRGQFQISGIRHFETK